MLKGKIAVFLLVCAALSAAGCGVKGPPLPPVPDTPQASEAPSPVPPPKR